MMMEAEDLQLKYKPSKYCGICGDKALGYNFNAVTCEACKAFFRRNALRTKQDFKCPFDGNCKIDLVTRRFCQKCRLKKCFDIGMKKEWILSEDEKKVKRDKIIENRRKKDHTGSSHPYNLDSYSNSSMDETYSPGEMKPSMKSLNSDLLSNPNYSLSVSEGKGFFNSLYLLEQYQNQYQNMMSGKSPKETPMPYSAPIAKVPNQSPVDHPAALAAAKSDLVLRSPPPMAATSGNSPLMDGSYSGIYPPKSSLDYAYAPFGNQHRHQMPHQQSMLHRSSSLSSSGNGQINGNFNGLQSKSDLHPIPSPYYHKPDTNTGTEHLGTRQLDQMSSHSSDSSYQYNSFYQDKNNIASRSRSESQIASPELALNGKAGIGQPNGSTDSGYTKENDEYLSSDEDTVPVKRATAFTADYPKDLNDDSNSVSNVDVTLVSRDLEMKTSSRSGPTVKPSLSVYNFIEELRMQELGEACDLLRPWCHYTKVVHEMLQISQMYEAVEKIISKVIEMARMVTTFSDLCEMEQMALLKGAVTEMIILRSVLNYVPEKESWLFNLDQAHSEGQFLKYSTYEKLICKGYYVEVKQFMHSFAPEWKNDKTLFDLLTVIILFTPNRPNLKHKEIIKLEHLTWRHLLQKHLDSKFASKEVSRNHFVTLMELLQRLHQINEKVNKMYTFKVIESFKL